MIKNLLLKEDDLIFSVNLFGFDNTCYFYKITDKEGKTYIVSSHEMSVYEGKESIGITYKQVIEGMIKSLVLDINAKKTGDIYKMKELGGYFIESKNEMRFWIQIED